MLNLTDNRIGKEGTKDLANALQINRTLTTLNLARNNISYEGTNYLAKALQMNEVS
jgi:Ran GTPase-activating protein (RanGAP) involved in mRNA processing and transport